MKSTKIHHSKKSQSVRLFHFTEHEERMMTLAILSSKKFMRAYGKGRAPYMIDRNTTYDYV